jgi:hypothetical protein
MRMTGLIDVEFSGSRHCVLIFLSQTYPFSLRSLALTHRIDAELGAFLETQPSLESLEIWHSPRPLPIRRRLTALPPEALPNLRSLAFEGFMAASTNLRMLRPILAGRPVRMLRLNTTSVPTEDYLGLLALPSVPLARLCVNERRSEAIAQIVHEVAQRAPELEDLELHIHVYAEDESAVLGYGAAVSDVGGGLGGFRKLARLALIASCELSETEKVVREWHQACPTLQVIEFSKNEMWQREKGCPGWQRCISRIPSS